MSILDNGFRIALKVFRNLLGRKAAAQLPFKELHEEAPQAAKGTELNLGERKAW